ncbi:MAG: shikimate kinase [Crocinitomicaceae bacterium]
MNQKILHLNDRHIFLIGMMGSGKTTIGQLLAKKIMLPFIDTDAMIEHSEGLSIQEIFSTKGEEYFRSLEVKCLENILNSKSGQIIACGGGLPIISGVMEQMKRAGIVVFLASDPELAYNRIQAQSHRPLLGQIESFSQLYNSRFPTYKNANITCAANGTPDEVVLLVLNALTQFEF